MQLEYANRINAVGYHNLLDLLPRRQLQPKKLAAYKLRECNPCGSPKIIMCVSNTTRLHEVWEKKQLEYGNRN